MLIIIEKFLRISALVNYTVRERCISSCLSSVEKCKSPEQKKKRFESAIKVFY